MLQGPAATASLIWAALATDTHKFEARYMDSLVGLYPEEAEVYEARSPIHFVDDFEAPMIVLQGSEDVVVPPNQADMIVAALEERSMPGGLPVVRG